MNKFTKVAGAAAAATLVAISGSAFTAANTMPAETLAGTGSVTISGFTVSNVEYDANSTNPENLDKVRFTLDKTARYVALKTSTTSTNWYRSDDLRLGVSPSQVDSCTAAGNVWTCDVTGNSETVAGATNITVVATN